MNSGLKIIIVGPAYPLRGGIATFDEMLCRTFQKSGHECMIVSYSLQYPSFLFPGKTQYDEESTPPQDIRIHPLINSMNPVTWYQTARFIKKQNPDVVIFRFWIPFMGPALGSIHRFIRKHGTKTLALVDNLIPHEPRVGDKLLTKYFMKYIHKYIVMSQEVKKDIYSLKPDAKCLLLRHPIYDHYGEPLEKSEARNILNIKKDGNIILFFGLIRKYKGLDLLMKAFAKMTTLNETNLLIAGEFYDNKKEYFDLAEELNIAHKIIWHDTYIPNEQVRFYFSACNILALPYRTATQSGVTQVAFHFETPVLVTNVGGLGEIIHHDVNGYVVEPEPEAIAQHLDLFFSNHKESNFREGMKSEKQQYSWENFTKKLIEYIDQ